jgi:hypothetical protein
MRIIGRHNLEDGRGRRMSRCMKEKWEDSPDIRTEGLRIEIPIMLKKE